MSASSNVIPLSTLLATDRSGRAPVAVASDATYDWASFSWHVAGLANCVEEARGSHWLLATEDAYALAVGLYAALHAGVTVYLPSNLQPGHLAALAASVDGALTHGGTPLPGVTSLPILGRTPASRSLALAPLDMDAALVVLHTSGTSDRPKSISKPLRCLNAEVATLDSAFGSLCPHSILATVPPYHIYGLLFRVLWPLASARTFASETVRFPGELSTSTSGDSKFALVSSPAFLKRALPTLELDGLRDSLSVIYSSGGPLPESVAAAYAAHLDHPVVEVYGSTETGGIAHRSVRETTEQVPWTVLPKVTVSAAEEDGLLKVKSPFLPDADWFSTADQVDILPDGRFFLKGRSDRVVKLEERRVSLAEIETRLCDCAEVDTARVLTLKGQNRDRSILGAVVVPSEGGWSHLRQSGKRALTDHLRSALRPFIDRLALPRKWRFVRHLPTTAHGKTTAAALANFFAAGGGRKLEPNILLRKQDGKSLQVQIELEADLLYFDGHFDVAPILAGVVQVDWAVRFGRDAFSISDDLLSIEALKFFKVLPAGSDIGLNLCYDTDRKRLSFRYAIGDTDYSSGRLVFQAQS